VLKAGGAELVGFAIYDKDKTSYRSEVDQALKAKPDLPISTAIAGRDGGCSRPLQGGYEGGKFAQSYAVTSKVLEALPRR